MKTWTKKWLVGLSTLCVLAAGHPAEGFSASVKAMGMGGAAVAFPQDSLTTVYNPASATALCCRWDVGLTWYYQHKTLNVSNRADDFVLAELVSDHYTSKTHQFLPEFGFNLWCNDCLTFGMSLNDYANINTRYKNGVNVYNGDLTSGAGTHARFAYQIGLLTATAAYRFSCDQSVGVAVNWYFGRLQVDGLDRFALPREIIFSADPQFLTNQGYDYTNGCGFTLGYYGHWDCLSIGASFSPKVYMREFHRYQGLLANQRLDIPMTWRLGVAYDWNPCMIFAADFEWRQYRDTPSWHNPFFNSQVLIGPPPVEINNPFGTVNGPGFDWKNQWMLKLGVNYLWNDCWTLRAGYRFESSLFKGNRTASFLNGLPVEVVQNYLTAGATWEHGCSELSVFGEWGIRHRIKGQIPRIEQIGPVISAGPSSIADINPGDLQFEKWSFALGVAYGQRF